MTNVDHSKYNLNPDVIENLYYVSESSAFSYILKFGRNPYSDGSHLSMGQAKNILENYKPWLESL